MTVGFAGLDDAVPADNAFIGDGAGQIRSVKNALNTVFPAVDVEITKPTGYGPVTGSSQPTSADYSQLFTDLDDIVNNRTTQPGLVKGMIMQWFGDPTLPANVNALSEQGWALCNSARTVNGVQVPDLSGRFVKAGFTASNGATVDAAGRTGPPLLTDTATPKTVAKTVAIAEENLPAHRHQFVLSISESDSDLIRPSDNILSAPTQTLVGAAQSGSYDGEYRLAYDPNRQTTEPDAGKTTKFGNDTPDALDIGLTANEFEHDHQLSSLDPDHVVLAFIIYTGTG